MAKVKTSQKKTSKKTSKKKTGTDRSRRQGAAGPQTENTEKDKKDGRGKVGLLGLYLILLSVTLILALVHCWPVDADEDEGVLFLWAFSLPAEMRLMMVVVIAGAMGGQVRILRAFAEQAAPERMERGVVAEYLTAPVVAASLALICYVAIRAVFFASFSGVEQANPYGFTAVAALVGLFSGAVIAKLKRVADAVLEK